MKITVDTTASKQRLDVFLTKHLGETRSQVKKLIEHGAVLVNGKTTTVHNFLKAGDLVEINRDESVKNQSVTLDLPILARGNGYLIIDKPSGLLVHPTPSSNEPTVVDWLIKQVPTAAAVGDKRRPGIVHRLDKNTSGCLILATTATAHAYFKRLFHDRQVKKTYTALVHGHLPLLQGEINKPIGRSQKGARMAARVQKISDKDRDAITQYEVLKSYHDYDLIQASPLTGRTHQIRVHLMSMGTPIVGDKIYTIHGQKKIERLSRLFLHAQSLSFVDMDGKNIQVNSPLPEKLQLFLNQLPL